jgi:3-oxoacyl-[acyl-carrier-protein] synthase-1
MTALVDVVATGARTPLGLSAEHSAAAVRAGVSRLREYPFVSDTGELLVLAADPKLRFALEGRERLLPMVESVLDEVLAKLGHSAPSGGYQILLALPEARPGFSDADAAWLADGTREHLGTAGIQAPVDLSGRGHAGAISAVERVVQESARRPDTLFLVIGADSYNHTDTFMWLESRLQFAQPGVRGGFFPGEGVGCLALATARLRNSLGVPCLASLSGAGTAQETLLRDSDTGSFGVGMSNAVLGAAAGLRLPKEAADTVYSDINGERYRSEEFGFMAMRAYAAVKTLSYEAPSDLWGDVGAAFPCLAAMLAAQSFVRGYAAGPRALVMAGSESGLRGAMVLQDASVS